MQKICTTFENGACVDCDQPQCDCRRLCKPWLKGKSRAWPKPTQSTAAHPIEICPHLLGPIGESVKLFGCGCASSSKNGIDVSVWGCELHGKCVTFVKGTRLGDETIKRCVACGDNPNVTTSLIP